MRQSWSLVAVLGASMLAMGQPAPEVIHAQFHTEAAGAELSATVDRFQRSGGPLWLGYVLEAHPGARLPVCANDARNAMEDGCCGLLQLEDPGSNTFSSGRGEGPPAGAALLVRIDRGAVERIRLVPAACRLDAGGLPFTLLTGVSAEQSIGWLSGLARAEEGRLADQALAAIAVHATERATAALAGFASPSSPLGLRERAAFWLAEERGPGGLAALEELMGDGNAELRRRLTFDLSTSRAPGAIGDLIRMANSDAEPRVRGEAIFWLGQRAGDRAAAAIRDAVANDPETEVKRRAVFALSRLPGEEAVSELIRVAETSSDPAVRREAIFWLGQTHDPRALAFFAKILQEPWRPEP